MAASTGKQDHKVLRIGIIQGGRIIEERLLRKPRPIRVGTDLRNDFSFPGSKLPRSLTLLKPSGGSYELSFTDGMSGRLSVKDAVSDFDQLKKGGQAKGNNGAYSLTLSTEARGKVNFGEQILLFQFVTPPPEPPRTQLPAVARGGIVSQMDWLYATIVMVSFIAHSSFLAYLSTRPIPEEISFEEIQDRFADILMPEFKEEKKEEKKEGKDETKAEEKKEEKQEEKKEEKKDVAKAPPPPEDPADAARRAAAAKAEMAKKVAGKGILKVLGSAGDGVGGAVADVFGQGGLDSDLDSAFEGAAGVEVATSANQQTRKGGGGGGEAATVTNLATAGAATTAAVKIAPKVEAKVSGSIQAAAPEVDGGELDPAKIASVVKARQSAIKTCYETALKKNPTLKGKIVLRMTIEASGRVTEASIGQDTLGSADLGDCIVAQVKRWRFPSFEGDEVNVSYPFIFAPQG